MTRTIYRSFLSLVASLAIAACGGNPTDTTAPTPATGPNEQGLTWTPRTAADPPATVTSIEMHADGSEPTVTVQALDWQKENADVRVRMQRVVSPAIDGVTGTTSEALSQDTGCGGSSVWFYNAINLGGSKVCIAGQGQLTVASAWSPVGPNGVALTTAPLFGTRSIYPGSEQGIVSLNDYRLPSVGVQNSWPLWGAWFNAPIDIPVGNGGQAPRLYLSLGFTAHFANMINNCGGHPTCLTGAAPPDSRQSYGISNCHTCVGKVQAVDSTCAVTWNSTCVAEATQYYHGGQCDSPNKWGDGTWVPGCPHD